MSRIPDEGPKFGPECVTFVIRDCSPYVFLGEPVRHRSVRIELTDEQRRLLQLRHMGVSCGSPIFEEVSQVFADEVVE